MVGKIMTLCGFIISDRIVNCVDGIVGYFMVIRSIDSLSKPFPNICGRFSRITFAM